MILVEFKNLTFTNTKWTDKRHLHNENAAHEQKKKN